MSATTPFLAIADAIVARLLEAPAITGDRVWRSRQRPLKEGMANGIVVRVLRSRGEHAGIGPGAPKDWRTLYGVEVYARGSTDLAAEDAVDALLALVYARLADLGTALAPSLAVEDIVPDPAISWDTDEASEGVCRATLGVTVIHRTQAGALAAWN